MTDNNKGLEALPDTVNNSTAPRLLVRCLRCLQPAGTQTSPRTISLGTDNESCFMFALVFICPTCQPLNVDAVELFLSRARTMQEALGIPEGLSLVRE